MEAGDRSLMSSYGGLTLQSLPVSQTPARLGHPNKLWHPTRQERIFQILHLSSPSPGHKDQPEIVPVTGDPTCQPCRELRGSRVSLQNRRARMCGQQQQSLGIRLIFVIAVREEPCKKDLWGQSGVDGRDRKSVR